MNRILPAIAIALFIIALFGLIAANWIGKKELCQGAQKRVEDTFKVMDTCQKLIGCTITVDDLRKAQEQINQAEACK